MKENNQYAHQGAKTITFRRGDEMAFVVTDGVHHAVFNVTDTSRKFFKTLHEAIASLEVKGYKVITDLFFN